MTATVTELRERIERRRRTRPVTCTPCLYLAALPEREREALETCAFILPWVDLATAVRTDPDHPIDISADTWARHYRGLCRAGRETRS